MRLEYEVPIIVMNKDLDQIIKEMNAIDGISMHYESLSSFKRMLYLFVDEAKCNNIIQDVFSLGLLIGQKLTYHISKT